MKRAFLLLLIVVAMAIVVAAPSAIAGHGGKTPTPTNVDDGSGGGGGAYPSQTGSCQIDGGIDNDPNTYGPGAYATLGTRNLRCNGNFWYDVSGDGFYMD